MTISQAVRRKRIRRVGSGKGPVRVVVLVAVLLIGLRNDAAGFLLQFARREHQVVLIARPFLIRSEAKPRGGAVLVVVALCRMAGLEVLPGIALLNIHARFVRPFLVAVDVEVVAEIPGNVGERAEAVDGVADEAAFVFASRFGMNPAVSHVKDEGNDHVPLAGELEHPIKPLPIGKVVACVVEAGVEGIVRVLRDPRGG